jgi:hypothetical protein
MAVGAALWRQSEEGPQILFCHSTRLIRWRHELRRFEPLNVLSFGDHGWHFQGATGAEFQAGDVMLCDFSLMPLLLRGSERDILAQFTTLTIDSRSPLKDGGVSLASDVMSSKWWKNLLRAFSSSACLGTKRLLIEGASPLEESIAIVDKARGHLNEKKRIELMAVKAAFVHHPRTFCSRRGNAGKSVIVWAKKRSRDASGNSEKEKDAALDLSGIKAELSLILEPLSHVQEMYEQPATNGITLRSPAQWEVRLCPFLPVQQAAYASSCSFVRGALSYSTLRLLSDAGKEVTPRLY